jgi:hypothetical protein
MDLPAHSNTLQLILRHLQLWDIWTTEKSALGFRILSLPQISYITSGICRRKENWSAEVRGKFAVVHEGD